MALGSHPISDPLVPFTSLHEQLLVIALGLQRFAKMPPRLLISGDLQFDFGAWTYSKQPLIYCRILFFLHLFAVRDLILAQSFIINDTFIKKARFFSTRPNSFESHFHFTLLTLSFSTLEF